MKEFREQFPKVSFELIAVTGPEITERIDKGLTDISLLLEPMTMRNILLESSLMLNNGEYLCIKTLL